MNSVTLIGRMTKDPELKYTTGGKGNTRFTIAVQRNKDEADFITCVAWERNAETIAEYFRKGNRIGVQGRLSIRSYEQNGENRWIAEVVVEKFDFIDTAGSSNVGYQQSTPKQQNSYNNYNNDQQSINNSFADDNNGTEENEDDFPF